MRSKIGELEQTVNDLKAEIEVEDAAKPKPQEDKPSHDSAWGNQPWLEYF